MDSRLQQKMKSLSDKITYQQFSEILSVLLFDSTTQQELLEAFRVLDKNNNGHIKLDDLKQSLTTLGNKMSKEEVDEVLQDVKPDKDGDIDYAELVNLLCKK